MFKRIVLICSTVAIVGAIALSAVVSASPRLLTSRTDYLDYPRLQTSVAHFNSDGFLCCEGEKFNVYVSNPQDCGGWITNPDGTKRCGVTEGAKVRIEANVFGTTYVGSSGVQQTGVKWGEETLPQME